MSQLSQTEFEAQLKSTHGKVGAVDFADYSVYFRRPTAEEYDELQMLSDDESGKRVAYARYVTRCLVGTYPDQLSMAQIVEREGPGVINLGGLGACVNRLAGAADRPTRML